MANQVYSYETIEEQKMPGSIDVKIRALLCECFPEDVNVYSHTRYWHGSAPAYSLICLEKDFLLGQAGVVVRQIVCNRQNLWVAGITNIVVHPRFRGRGLGKELMIKAQNEAVNRGISHGVLFCLSDLEKFYLLLGWHRHKSRVTMDDLSGNLVSIPENNIPMVKAFTDGSFPYGEIYLQGPDW